ncbi:heavy-metal-associated domain-containing protein [Natrialbaceae archaeon A-CW2]|uniref:heavy-metal-associated domain-containing protein n=1 Tax=Natronosalvus amylolyticus TaxID=2961994 RepID=UPI0020C97878|nr:heavy metal-associated domain-containing protein [Natronosalvus amylolyticus]
MTQTLHVTGMGCSGCEETIESALSDVEGVASANADNETDSVTVEGEADLETVIAVIEDAGYEAET